MVHITLLRLAAANLIRYRERSIAVLLPLFVVIALAASITFIKNGFEKDASLSKGLMPHITVQHMVAGRAAQINSSVGEQIRKLPHVNKVVPRIWGYIPMSLNKKDVAYLMMGILVQDMPVSKEIGIAIEQGRFLLPDDKNSIVAGKAFAAGLNVAAGDSVKLKDYFGNEDIFRVAGIFTSAVQIYTADLLLTTLEDARRFFGYGTEDATDLAVYLDDELFCDEVAAKIGASVPETRVLSRDVLLEITKQALGGRSGVFQLMWLILLASSILLAWAQGIHITIELRKEIGILKALGWSTVNIIELKTFESLLIGILGTLGGILGGLFYLHLGAPLIKDYFLGWSTVYPDFPIPVYPDPGGLLVLVCLGIFPLLVSSVIPSWLAGIIEPDRAIRE